MLPAASHLKKPLFFGLTILAFLLTFRIYIPGQIRTWPPSLQVSTSLFLPGFVAVKKVDPTISSNYSTSAGVTLSSTSNKLTTLTIIPIRVRDSKHFDLKYIAQFVNDARIVFHDSVYHVDRQQLAYSLSKPQTIVSSCLVRDGRFLVTSRDLLESTSMNRLSLKERFLVFLGFRLPRNWQCIYVQYSVASNDFSLDSIFKIFDATRALL
jgi:hypothetical protein